MITKKYFKAKLVSGVKLSMFQFAKWNVQLMHTPVTILGIYRSPTGSSVEFLTEFTNWITDIVVQDANFLDVEDFNLHITNGDDENAANFKESMVALGFIQHVARPTHKVWKYTGPKLHGKLL